MIRPSLPFLHSSCTSNARTPSLHALRNTNINPHSSTCTACPPLSPTTTRIQPAHPHRTNAARKRRAEEKYDSLEGDTSAETATRRLAGLQGLQSNQAQQFRVMLVRVSWIVVIYCFFRLVVHTRDVWPAAVCEAISAAVSLVTAMYIQKRRTRDFNIARVASIVQVVFYTWCIKTDQFHISHSVPLGSVFFLLTWAAENMLLSTADTIRNVRTTLEKTD